MPSGGSLERARYSLKRRLAAGEAIVARIGESGRWRKGGVVRFVVGWLWAGLRRELKGCLGIRRWVYRRYLFRREGARKKRSR